MAELTTKVTRIDGTSTNQIDAFVLVIKCTPRATSLKADIDHICNIFGSIALKSLVILLITPGDYYDISDDKVKVALNQMSSVIDQISKAKGEPWS